MNFNENVDKDFVDLVLESSLWSKAKIDVVKRETLDEAQTTPNEGDIGDIPEYEDGVVNEYEEPTDIDSAEEEDVTFTLDDLQTVLDNLDDDDLMEHAMNMLDVFDVAYDTLNEGDEDEEEEEEEEEEEAETKA